MPLRPVITRMTSSVASRINRFDAKVTEMVLHSPGEQVEVPTFLVSNDFSSGTLDLRRLGK